MGKGVGEMFLEYGRETRKVNNFINRNANNKTDKIRVIEREIQKWLYSTERKTMLKGYDYYGGKQDILRRKRQAIGKEGVLTDIHNLPNNKLVDNQYARFVDQKNNYILGKPLTVSCEDKNFEKLLKNYFNPYFFKVLRQIGEDALNCGVGYMYVFYDEGKLSIRSFKPYEILPFYKDDREEELEEVVRVYDTLTYEGERERTETKVEIYSVEGVRKYILEGRRLIPDGAYYERAYIQDRDGNFHNWEKIPIIPFKLNSRQIPLINRVKSLQDALNAVRSDFMNNMQEDSRNTILILKNYDGTDLGQFRKNLSQYGVVKVKSSDGANGGVDSLKIEVNCENYKVICDMLKKAICENAKGYDARDERFTNNPNQLNIKTMYSDIDLDSIGTETEFRESLYRLMWFVKTDVLNSYNIDYSGEDVDFVFNKDRLINESEIIDNCIKSRELVSMETVLSMHPWVKDIYKEIEGRSINV